MSAPADALILACRALAEEQERVLVPLYAAAEGHPHSYAEADSTAADFGERARDLVAQVAALPTEAEDEAARQLRWQKIADAARPRKVGTT